MKAAPARRAFAGYYQLVGNDQPKLNLVFLEKDKQGVRLRERYLHLACPLCGGFDLDETFDQGFDRDVVIRMKGDFGFTDDKALAISERMLNALQSERVRGFKARPVGREGWSVACIVNASPRALKASGVRCRGCGRPEERFGGYQRLNQMSVPTTSRSFFRPCHRRCSQVVGRRLDIADPFVTGDVIPILLDHKIRGGALTRLMSETEWRALLADHRQRRLSKYPEVAILR
jgi:hypothetical protein